MQTCDGYTFEVHCEKCHETALVKEVWKTYTCIFRTVKDILYQELPEIKWFAPVTTEDKYFKVFYCPSCFLEIIYNEYRDLLNAKHPKTQE